MTDKFLKIGAENQQGLAMPIKAPSFIELADNLVVGPNAQDVVLTPSFLEVGGFKEAHIVIQCQNMGVDFLTMRIQWFTKATQLGVTGSHFAYDATVSPIEVGTHFVMTIPIKANLMRIRLSNGFSKTGNVFASMYLV